MYVCPYLSTYGYMCMHVCIYYCSLLFFHVDCYVPAVVINPASPGKYIYMYKGAH